MGSQVRLALALCVAAMATRTGATEFFVARDGDDAQTGLSRPAAFRTIARGVKALGPGDTLTVGPGVWREEVFVERSGTPQRPITLRAEIPGRTELVGSVRLVDWTPVAGRPGVFRSRLDRPTWLVYEKDTDTEYRETAGLAFCEDQAGSFYYAPGERVLYVHPSDGLGMAHHVVDACVLDHGIASRTTAQPEAHTPRRVGLVIEGFLVRDYQRYGIFIHNADDCLVRNCVVHHCRRGIFFYSALRSRITGCEAFSCADRFNREQGTLGIMGYVFDCRLDHNIAHHTRQYGIRFYGGFYCIAMTDNLAYACDVGLHVKGQRFELPQATVLARFSDEGRPRLAPDAPFVFSHNIAHRATGSAGAIPNFCDYRHNVSEKPSAGMAKSRSANIEFDTPQVAQGGFADPAWHDFRLQSDSPWRKKGPAGTDPGPLGYQNNVFYVSPGGDEAADGTSTARAWRTLRHAIARLRAGQTLYLLPGVYRESIALDRLVADKTPTLLRAHGREGAVIDAAGAPAAIAINGCQGLRLGGIRVRNAAGCGVRVQDSGDVRIEENEIIDHRGDGVQVVGASTDVRLLSNTIVCNAGAGVKLGPEAADTWVVNNILRDNAVGIDYASPAPSGYFGDYNNQNGPRRSPPGAHDCDLAPGFIDLSVRDLRLQRTSLCRGRGYLCQAIGTGRIEPASPQSIRFTDVRVVGVTRTSADLAWSVTGGRATMLVVYGTDKDRLEQRMVRDIGYWYQERHAMTLAGLKPATRYYFRVGCRTLLDGPAPFHSYRYAWPERTPEGEADYYATLRKRDTFGSETFSFVTLQSDVAEGRQLHVDLRGDDAAPGTADRPLRTIARAAALAGPGDRVLVREGTYYEILRPARSGLPGRPVVFEAASGQRVEINGTRELLPFGVLLRDRRHIVVRGFVFSAQSEVDFQDGAFGQVAVIGSTDVRIEGCLFDGRMNYVNSILVHDSRDVAIDNCLFASHHAGLIAHDNPGTLRLTRSTFLGPTLGSVYAPRNRRLVIRNNLFAEQLFPKKKAQYKLKLPLIDQLDEDCNWYAFDPANDQRRIIDFMPPGRDPGAVTDLPERDTSRDRIGVKGDLAEWRSRYGQGRHSLVADVVWKNPAAVESARFRPRGFPDRFYPYPPLRREDLVPKALPPGAAAPIGADPCPTIP